MSHSSSKNVSGTEAQRQFKVSGLGWFCVWDRGEWLAVFKLTADQLREYRSWREAQQYDEHAPTAQSVL